MLKMHYKFILIFGIFLFSACGDEKDFASYAEKQAVKPKEDEVLKPKPLVIEEPVVEETVLPPAVVPVPGPLPLPLPIMPAFGGGTRPHPICGNGQVEGDEQCDDGNTNDSDLCSRFCRLVGDTNLTLLKVVNNTGGGTALPADFDLILTGDDGIHDDGVIYHSGDVIPLTADISYTLSELDPPLLNYVQTSIVCIVGTTGSANPFVAVAGEPTACTVTNSFVPPQASSLTLEKIVNNDSGGDAEPSDFTLVVTAGGTPSNHADGDVIALTPGVSYGVTEPNPLSGYQLSGSIVCMAGMVNVGNPFQAQAGQDVTCTVTNDDIAPTLSVTKVIVGGTGTVNDFGFVVDPDDDDPIPLNFPVVQYSLNAGVEYTFLELMDGGYDDEIVCTLNGQPASTTITPALGDEIVCTVTNTATIGLLNLQKVIGDGGGALPADFTLTVTLTGNSPVQYPGGSASNIPLVVGSEYTVGEIPIPNYNLNSVACDSNLRPGGVPNPFTVLAGEVITCEVVNVFSPPPTLTFVKQISGGGPNQPGDFVLLLSVDFSEPSGNYHSGDTINLSTSSIYSVAEDTPPAGYSQAGINCTSNLRPNVNQPFSPAVGEQITCTIINLFDANQ